ncbi:carbon-nitrogen hydrolase family protein [Carboxylicivirga caseinilyticus]|uniref:carbon-nitrogen hydrolase family protein n=1 Tax=Carboxylicivirga caseinilyticus TaxID=3417572 RepID=UPI003D32FA7D|nr:carbon-nitrogen hydrolase family protein [Marinilabiliaceae bacterium A049]
MIVASAQTKPSQGVIHENLENHIELIKLAAQNNAQLILFPELSLTSYVREEAKSLSISIYDEVINQLRQYAMDYNISIVAGAPVYSENGLHIGSFIITPEGGVDIYTKQYLHEGEDLFYKPSFSHNPVLYIGDYKSQFAICADLENPDHILAAKTNKAKLYLAGIFYTPQSMDGLHKKMAQYSKKHQINILISNFVGESYGFPAGGRSAFWNDRGEKVAELDSERSGILLMDIEEGIQSKELYL